MGRARCLPLALLAIVATGAAADPALAPWVTARHGRVALEWQRDGERLIATATLHGPELRILRRTQSRADDTAKPPEGIGEAVRESTQAHVDVDSVEIRDGTILFSDVSAPERVRLRIHALEATVENFSTQRARSAGLPMLVTARGRVGDRGRIAMFMTANPWTGELDLAGRVQIVEVGMRDVAGLLERQLDVRPTDGTITVFIEFSVHRGQIDGAVRTFISNATVAPSDPGWFDQLKSWFVSGVIALLEVDVRGDQQIATTVPLRGRLQDPETNMWDAVLGLVGNAFVDALEVGFVGTGGGREP